MKHKNLVGAKIYALRKEHNFTQGALADKIGVSRAAISQFELGDTLPSSETLKKLSEALGFDLSDTWQSSPATDKVEDDFIDLPFIPISSYPSFMGAGNEKLDNIHHISLNNVPVLRMPGISYNESYVVEIKGNSMAPRYPNGARYVMEPVEGDLKYAIGVHLFVLNHKSLFVRRIIANKGGVLTLRADATGEETTLEIAEMMRMREAGTCHMLKLGQAVHMPPED